MENPTFRLEGVVKSADMYEDFEGPLTLILQLLTKNKIEIQDIRISDLLDQYLQYLDEMKSMDLEIASEFVVMASHLVYIKARMLLSAGEEPTELEELIESLEKLRNKDALESVKAVTGELGAMYLRGAGSMTKPPEPRGDLREYAYSHTADQLIDALMRAVGREDMTAVLVPEARIPVPKRIVYPVTDKAQEIIELLRERGSMGLTALMEESHSRTELVATFIALLELCREGRIALTGEGDDTTVSHLSDTAVADDLDTETETG